MTTTITYRAQLMSEWPYQESTDRDTTPLAPAGWGEVLQDLGAELGHLDAREATFGVVVHPDDLRAGKRPEYMMDRPAHPGTAVSFQSRYGRLTFPCDAYIARLRSGLLSWQANTHAIVHVLQCLRTISCPGTATEGTQYLPWREDEEATR